MEKLKQELDRFIERLENADDFRSTLEMLVSVYPFNEYEYIISHLLAADKLTLAEYLDLRDAYVNRNLYLYIFEISAPRGLGDRWALGHLKELVPELQRPSKKLDSKYSGEYDFWMDGMRVEVKTSRAVDFERPDEPLYLKALSSDSNRPFDMNFQQIKPDYADVFIWIGVWRDRIRYWVLSSNEARRNRYYSKGQHRGNVGEGQLHLTHENITAFARYETPSIKIKQAMLNAYKRQRRTS